MNLSVYQQMLLMANHYDLPLHYNNDLFKHDKRWCDEYDPKYIFGWVLEEYGTHIIVGLNS